MGGRPVFHMITMINIDVLEQWWLAQFGLSCGRAAAGGPRNIQLWPSLKRGAWAAQSVRRGGVENPSSKVENINFH